MKRVTVMATAVGAIVGYGIIEGLRLSGMDIHVVGTDIFPDAVGRYLCDEFVVSEPAASPYYIEYLENTVKAGGIDLVLFGIEQEIDAVCAAYDTLEEQLRQKLAVNPPALNALFRDKWRTRAWLVENGLADLAIPSAIEGEFEPLARQFGLPFLLKPRTSRAGKGIVSVDCEKDFVFYREKMGGDYMAQQMVGTNVEEYTVGVFGLGDGSFSDAIYLRRRLSQEGATAKAEVVFDNAALIDAAERLTAACRPEGPTNYQFRLTPDGAKLLEVNPRISSSTSIRAKFGFNEPAMCIEYYLLGRRPSPCDIRAGKVVRYIKDWVVEP